MSAKTKPPRRLFRRRPSPSFHDAMLQVAVEDLVASPCVGCDQAGDYVGVWSPTADVVANELGGDRTKFRQLYYRLCRRCARRCQDDKRFVGALEDKVLELWRAGNVIRVRSA